MPDGRPWTTGPCPAPAAVLSWERRVRGTGDGGLRQGHGRRAVHRGAGRFRLWAASPLSYLPAPVAHPGALRARRGRCGMARHLVRRPSVAPHGVERQAPDLPPAVPGEEYATLYRLGCA
jgi:hypothetical protein